MPIRFRCAYCNQLLGIARRKAGTVVRCPTCSGQVIVPQPEDAEFADPEPPQKPHLFERADFDEVFNPNAPKAPAPAPKTAALSGGPPPARSAPRPSVGKWSATPDMSVPPDVDVERVGSDPVVSVIPAIPAPEGLVLSPRQVRNWSIAALVVLVVTFALGFLMGALLHSAPPHSGGESES